MRYERPHTAFLTSAVSGRLHCISFGNGVPHTANEKSAVCGMNDPIPQKNAKKRKKTQKNAKKRSSNNDPIGVDLFYPIYEYNL